MSVFYFARYKVSRLFPDFMFFTTDSTDPSFKAILSFSLSFPIDTHSSGLVPRTPLQTTPNSSKLNTPAKMQILNSLAVFAGVISLVSAADFPLRVWRDPRSAISFNNYIELDPTSGDAIINKTQGYAGFPNVRILECS